MKMSRHVQMLFIKHFCEKVKQCQLIANLTQEMNIRINCVKHLSQILKSLH